MNQPPFSLPEELLAQEGALEAGSGWVPHRILERKIWLGSIMDNIGVYYTHTFYMYKSKSICATWA